MSKLFSPTLLAIAAALAASLAGPVSAKAAAHACYTTAELEAEEYLRLHSELMVATVTCKTDDQGNNLVPAYTGFTKINIAALHAAEMTMQQYYKVNYGGNGQARLDDLRTKLGNEYGQEMADTSAQKFCDKYRNKPIVMASSSEPQVKAEVTRMMVAEKTMVAPCPGAIPPTKPDPAPIN